MPIPPPPPSSYRAYEAEMGLKLINFLTPQLEFPSHDPPDTQPSQSWLPQQEGRKPEASTQAGLGEADKGYRTLGS